MHPLAGSYFRFEIDEVLVGWGDTPRLFTAHTPDGQAWLVWLAANTLDTRCWLCAPASDWAIGCVMSGRALPVDLFRHSSTGTVEEITVGADGWLAESFRLCDGLSDDDVPTATRLLSPVGSSGS
jgi:hypothetical protein